MRIPTAAEVLKNSQTAPSAPPKVGTAVATRAVDPVRLGKAAAGLVKLASPVIARYFDINVAEPFPAEGSTRPISLAHVPQWFAFTALGKELKAAHGKDDHLAALTAPLTELLATKGFAASFSIEDVGEHDNYYRLMLSLKPRDP